MTIFILHLILLPNSFYSNGFWNAFLIFSACSLFEFLKTSSLAYLCRPMLNSENMKIQISSQVSAPSYALQITSKLKPFFTHNWSLYKRDFLEWSITYVSLDVKFISSLENFKASCNKFSLIEVKSLWH